MEPDAEAAEHGRMAELLAALVDSSQDAIIAKDLNGIIQTWNKGAERVYGYREEETVGRSAMLLLPPDRANEEREILTRVRAGESVDHFETTRVRKDGSQVSVLLSISPVRNAAGTIIGASHIARNITERALIEAAAAHLAAVVGSSEDAIISKNLDGIILTWNAAAERIYGYAAEEVRWRHMSILLPPDRRDEEDAILDQLKRGERVEHFETVRVRKDGRLVDVSLSISPIRDHEGAVRGASHIARDITAQKAFQAKLLQAQKLESLGLLAGGVAHDFNNLLVGILANSTLLASSLPPSNPQRKIVLEVVTAAERAAALTRQLLAYAGKGRFVVEPLSLSALIREVNTLVQPSISPKVQVRLQLTDGLPPVEGDAGQLQQVIMNLVINGAESIGDAAGLVMVRTAVEDVDGDYSEAAGGRWDLEAGRYVAVEVSDNGCGMDEETVQKIFDPFFTTKRSGRGLGLAAVLGIVRGHKGTLKVYSVPGKGTSFKVFFPASPRGTTAPAAAQPERELTGRGTVLVVDDEEVVRKAAKYTLRRYGYNVLPASGGREAVQVFRGARGQISLVLLDLTMPDMDGEEVLREMQSIDPAVRVILSSGFNEVEAIRRFTGKGLAGFLQKPYTSSGLATRVKQVLESGVRGAPGPM